MTENSCRRRVRKGTGSWLDDDDDDDDDDDTFQQRSPLSMSWDTQCPKLEMPPGRLPDGTRRRG